MDKCVAVASVRCRKVWSNIGRTRIAKVSLKHTKMAGSAPFCPPISRKCIFLATFDVYTWPAKAKPSTKALEMAVAGSAVRVQGSTRYKVTI